MTSQSGKSNAQKPRLLDLFCGAGGAAQGYHRAGFEVVGVDVQEQPNYPFEFEAADAFEFMDGGYWRRFDAIHASPPCQAYSNLNAYNRKSYPDLVAQTRHTLRCTGLPYVIENVPRAPLENPVILCGAMFQGLRVYRHRGFEANFPLCAPEHPKHVNGCARNGYIAADHQFMSIHGGKHSKAWQRQASRVMGCWWMQTIPEVCEAIPPAYTELIGRQLMAHICAEAAVTVASIGDAA